MSLTAILPEAGWRTVLPLADYWAVESRPKTAAAAEALLAWFHVRTGEWHTDPARPPAGFGAEPWLPVKTAATVGDALHRLLQTWQLSRSPFSDLYGGPHPVASMLAGGLLGAGLGYGGARLAEHVVPSLADDEQRKQRFRGAGAVLGGLAGAAPGALVGHAESQHHPEPWKAWVSPPALFDAKESADRLAFCLEQLPKLGADLTFMPSIPVDAFNQAVWADPGIPEAVRAATTGLVGAAALSRDHSPIVSPWDVARIAVGMGSGYASGLLVGKVLGALANVSPQTQEKLRQTGMWAGAINAFVPRVFGLD